MAISPLWLLELLTARIFYAPKTKIKHVSHLVLLHQDTDEKAKANQNLSL